MDEADQVALREAMLHGHEGAPSVKAPDLGEEGVEADAMLVHRPHFDGRLWEGGRHLPQQGAEVGFELGLGLWVGPDMARPWFQPTGAEAPQGAPAQVTTDLAAESLGQPVGHGPSAPAVALGMWASHGCS